MTPNGFITNFRALTKNAQLLPDLERDVELWNHELVAKRKSIPVSQSMIAAVLIVFNEVYQHMNPSHSPSQFSVRLDDNDISWTAVKNEMVQRLGQDIGEIAFNWTSDTIVSGLKTISAFEILVALNKPSSNRDRRSEFEEVKAKLKDYESDFEQRLGRNLVLLFCDSIEMLDQCQGLMQESRDAAKDVYLLNALHESWCGVRLSIWLHKRKK